MENNQPPTPPVQPNPMIQLSTPPTDPTTVIQGPAEKQKLKEKLGSLPKQTKIMIYVGLVVFFILFSLVVLAALFGKKPTSFIATPTPSPISATPGPDVILNASRYATDSGVLKIESDLNNFQKQLETTDIKQTDLNQPNMDFNIKFDQ